MSKDQTQQPQVADDEYAIAEFLLPLVGQTITLKNETLFTISPKELIYAIRTHYISREEHQRSVGEARIDEVEIIRSRIRHEGLLTSNQILNARADEIRNQRRELGLEGET